MVDEPRWLTGSGEIPDNAVVMIGDAHDDVTLLIAASRAGDAKAKARLFEVVYEELRRIARKSRHAGSEGETLQPTALANEAYLLLSQRFPLPPKSDRESRETFFRTVAQAMRMILRDYWRQKNTEKRGGGAMQFTLRGDEPDDAGGDAPVDFLQLDEALDRLRLSHERWYDVLMHRYFAGRTVEETAELMGVGVTTVKTDWQSARTWLRRELKGSENDK